MTIHLIGQKETKRFEYFAKACNELNVDLKFWDLRSSLCDLISNISSGDKIKIDPLKYESSYLNDLNDSIEFYKYKLKKLHQIPDCYFLNSPSAIISTLDKKKCKHILDKNNISNTPKISFNLNTIEKLDEFLLDLKIYNVFLKPNWGSGAAGVMSYRISPKTQKKILETSLHNEGSKFINTKKIQKIFNPYLIKKYIEFLLNEDFILERWIPKAKYKNISYDLRAVFQFDSLDFIVARGSNHSSITNLHLNNSAIDISEIGLSNQEINKIINLGKKSLKTFKGLNSVGMDILVKPNHNQPMIIELNSQGDLLYKDIYNENRIYKNQVLRMVKND